MATVTKFADEITYSDDITIPTVAVVVANDEAVSAESAALIESERAIATAHGFAHDDKALYFAPGTKLMQSGMDKSAEYAREYAALPSVVDAATAHQATITRELRVDRKVNLREWYLDSNGLLRKDDKCAASLTAHSWSQLCNQQPTESTAVRGNVNSWIGDGTASTENLARVRGPANARQVYAILSSGKRGYTVYDSHQLLWELARAMPGTKCKTTYNAATTSFTAHVMVQAPVDIAAFVGVGRIHQAGIRLETADNGSEAIDLLAEIVRIRCMNHTLTSEKTGRVHLRHTGNFQRLYAALGTIIGTMPTLIGQLRKLWCRAATEHYLDSETGLQLSIPEAIERLVLLGHLPTAGLTTEAAIAAYVTAWRTEEVHSAAGVVMAVQRASHEFTSSDSSWRASEWAAETEEIASNMLYQPVYTLDQPSA